jgi:hypothetical protein
MKRLSAPVFLFSLLAAILTGCINTSRIIATGLKGELTGIICGSDGTVTATWHVTNTNVVSYLFARVRSKVYVNGSYVGMIVNENPLGIPASTEVDRSGQITGSDAAAKRVLADALAHGSASYQVDTQVTVRIYGDTVEETKLSHSGTVPVTAAK